MYTKRDIFLLRIRHISFTLFFILFGFCLSTAASGQQQWSGLLAPNRATNWSNAGAGSIPARTSICQTLGIAGQSSSYPQAVTASQILSALQSCPSGQTVLLNPGTYTMTQTLGGTWPSNVTLRGSGANQTILKFTGTSSNCNGIGATAMCISNGDNGAWQYSANILNWTGGYSQGSTTITLGSAVNGSLSNLHVGSLIALNQLDGNSDNGNWWSCGTGGTTGSCSQQGTANAWAGRSEMQTVTVTGISGSSITISPAIYAPNWSGSSTPYATFSSALPVTGVGIENLQVNTQSLGDIQAMVETVWATNSWIKNVAFINAASLGGAARKHAEISFSAHFTVRDSYLFGSSPSSEGYGIDFLGGTSDSLAENNISQHIATGYILETGIGNVFGYNYAVDNFYTGGGYAANWQQCDAFHHDAGDYYNLWEGHEGICATMDDIHGTAFSNTFFRSYLSGLDAAKTCSPSDPSCGTQPKNQNTMAFDDMAYARYMNLVANVLGTQGYHNTYANVGASGNPGSCPAFNNTAIYSLNFADQNQTPFSSCIGASWTLDNDSLVSASLMRWGNYDVVNGSVQTNSNETASNASTYPGLSSPSTTWASYPSFYVSSKPSWWGSMPWPAVGPDVAGGNIANVGGHAYHNPAATCYLNVLGGKTDGSSGVLNFDAASCYNSAQPQSVSVQPPTGLTATLVQ